MGTRAVTATTISDGQPRRTSASSTQGRASTARSARAVSTRASGTPTGTAAAASTASARAPSTPTTRTCAAASRVENQTAHTAAPTRAAASTTRPMRSQRRRRRGARTGARGDRALDGGRAHAGPLAGTELVEHLEPDHPDVAGTERHDDVAGRGALDEVPGHRGPGRLEHDLLGGQRHVRRHGLPAGTRDRRLAGGEHLQDDHLVGQPEGGSELLDEHGRAVVVVRLERHDQAPLPDDVARGPQGRVDLRRMVRVVVEHPDLADLALEVEAPAGAAERLEPGAQVRRGVVQPEPRHERRQGVQRVVLARDLAARSRRAAPRCARCRRPSPCR